MRNPVAWLSLLGFCAAQQVLCLGCFFFNDPATTEIYTLSLHDALPICSRVVLTGGGSELTGAREIAGELARADRKSTRLNSSHGYISYAVFCLKKKKKNKHKSHHG